MEREFGDKVGSSTRGAQSQMDGVESRTQGDIYTKPVERLGPCRVFFPSHTTQEWYNIMNYAGNGVGLSGSAAVGQMGPVVGSLDMGESDDAYFFRVSIPGVATDEKEFEL